MKFLALLSEAFAEFRERLNDCRGKMIVGIPPTTNFIISDEGMREKDRKTERQKDKETE